MNENQILEDVYNIMNILKKHKSSIFQAKEVINNSFLIDDLNKREQAVRISEEFILKTEEIMANWENEMNNSAYGQIILNTAKTMVNDFNF